MSEEFMFRKAERKGVHFHGRTRSKNGIAGFALAVAATVLFLVLCILSAAAKGAAGLFVGALGLVAMIFCGIAFWLCFKGLKEQDVYTKLPFAGMILAGIMFVLLFCLYIVGI